MGKEKIAVTFLVALMSSTCTHRAARSPSDAGQVSGVSKETGERDLTLVNNLLVVGMSRADAYATLNIEPKPTYLTPWVVPSMSGMMEDPVVSPLTPGVVIVLQFGSLRNCPLCLASWAIGRPRDYPFLFNARTATIREMEGDAGALPVTRLTLATERTSDGSP